MTTPPAPPPAPDPPAPPAPTAADVAKLTASLEEERRQRIEARKELDRLRAEGMTEAEKAIAKAREEGKAEAARDAALVMVAAEFKVQAAGKIANPDAALAAMDLGKLLDDKGQPDKTRIGKLVEHLAAVPAPGGHVPTGPRQPANGQTDFFRETLRQQQQRG